MADRKVLLAVSFWLTALGTAAAGVGDPQVRTDHPWYPGELACSTFERLFATQAELYQRVVGTKPQTDQEKALAAWLWRNTHYYHGEEGAENLWGQGFARGGDLRTREYWTGLFAHGFGLCGTTHSQWIAEMEALFGHNRGRGVGAHGHNAFEVLLKGGPYGDGKWVLLDHDLSTVIFDDEGKSLLSLSEVYRDWKRLTDRRRLPEKQHGWLVCGLHPNDGESYRSYQVAEYLAGYAGPPPRIHLRRGEKVRRYLQPGLGDRKTYVFWGRNYQSGPIPGPSRSETWVNQPERMYGSRDGAGHRPGQARYGNAVYTYRPDFSSTAYREGVIDEDQSQVTFEFCSPYIIAATPPTSEPWGIDSRGCRNGLVLQGSTQCAVAVSTDRGRNWHDCGAMMDGMDLTDQVKGHRQYWLRFHAAPQSLRQAGLTITTVCQCNSAILPRLKDDGCEVKFEASHTGLLSAGPTLPQAQAHVVAGKLGSPTVTLELRSPRQEPVAAVYSAAHVLSGNPPRPEVKYQIDVSLDGGRTWTPMLKDWSITRRGNEPEDFWSQSFCWGALTVSSGDCNSVQVRFRNSGGKNFARCEAHLAYRTPPRDATKVTFGWSDSSGSREASHVFPSASRSANSRGTWHVPTGKNVQTHWVEFEPLPAPGG